MDDYYILSPADRHLTVSDYLYSLIPDIKSYKHDDADYTLLSQDSISLKRFEYILKADISFEEPPKSRIQLLETAPGEVYYELLVNALKHKLHTIDFPLYLSILIWEEKVITKAHSLKVDISNTNCILLSLIHI